jgi:hypothetical protein
MISSHTLAGVSARISDESYHQPAHLNRNKCRIFDRPFITRHSLTLSQTNNEQRKFTSLVRTADETWATNAAHINLCIPPQTGRMHQNMEARLHPRWRRDSATRLEARSPTAWV